MHKDPGMQRVFIGIPVDGQSQQLINALLDPIKKLHQDIRWEPANNWHLTLAFLGNLPAAEVECLLRSFDGAYQQESRFNYRLTTLTRFPTPAGRIIALVDDPTGPLDRLFQLTRSFLDSNKVELHLKAFRPHITLGRIRKAKYVKTNFDQQTNINLNINKIAFYQSAPSESGSIYTALKESTLN